MLVTLAYEDLVSGKDLTEDIYRAYGPEGLGALTVSGIPEYAELREKLLPLAYNLAHLPAVCPDLLALMHVGANKVRYPTNLHQCALDSRIHRKSKRLWSTSRPCTMSDGRTARRSSVTRLTLRRAVSTQTLSTMSPEHRYA
jgi:hypothetical protein